MDLQRLIMEKRANEELAAQQGMEEQDAQERIKEEIANRIAEGQAGGEPEQGVDETEQEGNEIDVLTEVLQSIIEMATSGLELIHGQPADEEEQADQGLSEEGIRDAIAERLQQGG